MKSNKTIEERFFARITKTDTCWVWNRTIDKDGYGIFCPGRGIRMKAHRWSYEFHKGPLNGLCACHRCDVRRCVNPEHLFPGTDIDNLRDRTQKGRDARGEASGATPLTEAQVMEIRSLYAQALKIEDIAAMYGVTDSSISNIATGRTWKHLGGICAPRLTKWWNHSGNFQAPA